MPKELLFIPGWNIGKSCTFLFTSAQVSTVQTLLSSSYQLIYLVRTFVSEVFGEIGNIFPKLVCLLLNFLSFPNSKCKDNCKGLNWISKTTNKKRSTIIFVTDWTWLGYNAGGHNLFYLGRLQQSLLIKPNQTYKC